MVSKVNGVLNGLEGEQQINLTALQRIDDCIVEIIDSASQVALYNYCCICEKWEEPGIKGSLFLYKRSRIPYHGFVIMNQINTTNQVEPFISGLHFQVEEPYLLYISTSRNAISGIWFYEVKEFFRVKCHIQQIVRGMKGKARRHRQRSESDSSLAKTNKCGVPRILSLLSNAQMIYEKEMAEGKGCNRDVCPNSAEMPVQSSSTYSADSKIILFANDEAKISHATSEASPMRQRLLSLDENNCNYFKNGSFAAHSEREPVKDDPSVLLPNNCLFNGTYQETSPVMHRKEDPQVLTPAMFQSAVSQSNVLMKILPNVVSEALGDFDVAPAMDKAIPDFPIKYKSCQSDDEDNVSLHKNHISQAIIHLISNESNALAKIHGAYITSLNSYLSTLSSS